MIFTNFEKQSRLDDLVRQLHDLFRSDRADGQTELGFVLVVARLDAGVVSAHKISNLNEVARDELLSQSGDPMNNAEDLDVEIGELS